MSLPSIVFVLGGPGAGKGTQCENIVRDFGFVHLSAGDLLRAERQREGSKVGEEIETHIRNGTIVPVEVTCRLIDKAIQESGKNKFLIDGFPRNEDNLNGWNRMMSEKTDLKFVLFFDCPEEVCVDRCLSRGQTSGRSDDNTESLRKRIHTYTTSTMAIINHFETKNLARRIDANQSPDNVYGVIKKLFSQD